MDAEVEGWDGVARVGFWEADGVFFGGEEGVEAAVGAAFGEALDFLFGEAVVVGEPFADVDGGAELFELFFKTFGARDAGERADEFAFEPFERELFASVEVDEVERCVGALDDVGEGVVFADGLDEVVVPGGVAFGEKNVVGSANVVDGFAQCAAREEEPVTEGRLRVHETDFDAASERQVLHAIIEEEGVGLEVFDGGGSCAAAVAVGKDDDVAE
jgi:hypothetical protein